MADTQIDELRLDITVEDNTSGESSDKKVKNLATAISRLNKVLGAFDNAKFSKTFENMAKGIEPFVKKIDSVSSALESLATIVKKSGLEKAVEQATSGLPAGEKKGVDTGSGGGKEPIQAMGGQATPLGQTSNELKKVNKQIDDLDKKSKKSASGISKLMKSFGRIAMYRAVRRAIQEITQAFTESIDGIARYNSEFRDTMGSLQSSMAKLKTSIGVGLYQVLIVLEPVITAISNGIVNLANSLSKVTANLRGVAEYTKINTDYMKDYQSATQGALLSFDTFNTLSSNQGIDYSQMLDTGTDALDEENFTDTENSLKRIFELIQTIGKTAQKVWNGGLKDIISTILDIVLDIVSWVAKGIDYLANIDLGGISALEAILWGIVGVLAVVAIKNLIVAATNPFTLIALGIAAVVAAIAVLIANWDKVVNFFKTTCKKIGNFFTDLWHGIANGFANIINGICNGFISFVNMLIDGINALLTPINEVGKRLGASENFAQIPHWEAQVNWQPYADGGMFEGAGTMYALAGESGAEVVATGSAGTGVLNVDQFADAMVSALVRYGAARDTSNGTTIVLDGNKVGQLVASNVGFRNEANRRNAGLNWK